MATNNYAGYTGLDQDGLIYLLQLIMADIKAAAPDLSNYVQTETVNEIYNAIPELDTAITSEATATAAASSKAVYDYVRNALADITSFSARIVEELPEAGETNILYLIAKDPTGESGNVYDEYLYINGNFELVGTTAMDLSDYVLASDMHALTNSEISAIYAEAKAAVNG